MQIPRRQRRSKDNKMLELMSNLNGLCISSMGLGRCYGGVVEVYSRLEANALSAYHALENTPVTTR